MLSLVHPLAAQERNRSGPLSPKEIEAFADPIFAAQMEELRIPGAVLVVVKDGNVLLAKGYGYANREKKTPVEPEKTLFYLASVTKTFTATAVMQLVEAGQLDLHRDVNRYLSNFQLENSFTEPVTLAHLLTHTAGFDDKNIGYVARTASETIPLGDYLASAMPPRVMPPGRVISYSNHGFGLAGHLVELVSGVPYSQYIEKNILGPLGMTRSTARVPPPPELAPDLAAGYRFDFRDGELRPQPLGYRNLSPAGSISATGADIARFMIAHLQNGRYGKARILTERTTREMHRQQFTHHPHLPGFAYGFYERFHNNVRILEHAGGYIGFATLLVLLPEENVGVFVAGNSTNSGLHYQFLRQFLDHYYPAPQQTSPAMPGPPTDLLRRAGRLAGSYQMTRYSRRSVEKIAILDSQLQVSVSPDAVLVVQPRHGKATRWAAIEPLLFRRVDSKDLLAFREDANGRITHMFTSLPGGALPVAFEKLHWKDSLPSTLGLLSSLGVIFVSTFTLWPLVVLIGFLVQFRRGPPLRPAQRHRLASVLAGFTGFLIVVFLAGMDTLIGNSQYRLQLVYGMTPEMVALLWIPLVTSALTVALVYFAVHSWRKGWWSLAGRLHYSLVTLAALAFIPFLLNWNLLGFRY